jgi:transcription antitermination factor NusG
MAQDTATHQPPELQWLCLRTQPKREQIAATFLAERAGYEVYAPRISRPKATRQGKKRFVTALFPGYFFCHANPSLDLQNLRFCQGVRGVAERNGKPLPVPDAIIAELRAEFPHGVTEAPDPSLEPGAEVAVCGGALKGLRGKVLACLSDEARLKVLFDWLGQPLAIEISAADVAVLKGR